MEEQTLLELNQKIDALATQVAYLTAQAQAAERQRQERAELMETLMPITNQAFAMTVAELEEIEDYVDRVIYYD